MVLKDLSNNYPNYGVDARNKNHPPFTCKGGTPKMFSVLLFPHFIGVVNRHFRAKLHVSSTNHLEGKPRTDGRTAGQTNGHDTLNYKSAET